MTTLRQHAETAALYFSDNTLKCWARNKNSDNEWTLMPDPCFNRIDFEYYVGHEPPPPIKRTITLTVNGRMWLLPKPLKGPFHLGRAYYVAGEDGCPSLRVWEHTDVDKLCQSKLRMNDTEADCQAWAYFDKWCRGGGV